jgi:hypothetical protein
VQYRGYWFIREVGGYWHIADKLGILVSVCSMSLNLELYCLLIDPSYYSPEIGRETPFSYSVVRAQKECVERVRAQKECAHEKLEGYSARHCIR